MAEDEQFERGVDGLCPRCSMLGRSHFFSRLIHGYSPDPVLVSRFHCEDAGCGAVIDEVQLAGRCAAAGVRLSLAVPKGDTAVLGRLLLKADTATISIPELEFEISPNSSMPFEGVLTTVGSCLRTACDNLSADQEQRQAADPETASRIGAFIQELREHAAGQHAFTLVVEDPAGNSYIGDPGGAALPEGEAAPAPGGAPADPQLTVEHYQRSAAEQERLGVGPGSPEEEEGGGGAAEGAGAEGGQQRKPAVMQLVEGEAAARLVDRYAQGGSLSSGGGEVGAGPCPACGAERSGQERQLLPSVGLGNCTLLDTHCCGCGLRAVELRRGGGSGPASSANGLRIQLAVEQPADLERDVIASSSASLVIPELGLAFSGGEEGVFTTVGALVRTVVDGMAGTQALQQPLADQEANAAQQEWQQFAADLQDMLDLRRPFTLLVTDPQGASHISQLLPEEPDSRLTLTRLPSVGDEPPQERGPAGSAA